MIWITWLGHSILPIDRRLMMMTSHQPTGLEISKFRSNIFMFSMRKVFMCWVVHVRPGTPRSYSGAAREKRNQVSYDDDLEACCPGRWPETGWATGNLETSYGNRFLLLWSTLYPLPSSAHQSMIQLIQLINKRMRSMVKWTMKMSYWGSIIIIVHYHLPKQYCIIETLYVVHPWYSGHIIKWQNNFLSPG